MSMIVLAVTNRRSAAVHRRSSAAMTVKIHSGAAANSFANTPTAPSTPARRYRPRHSAIAINGPSMYINGSDVEESNSEYNDPVPSADSHVPAAAADGDIPSTRQKRPTASAAAVFATTAYVFH